MTHSDDAGESWLQRNFTVCASVALVVVAIGFHLGLAAAGYPMYRDQHLGAAIDYARNGVDWLHPVIPGFTANGVATPQEFPIWQALAGWLLRWGGEWWGMANLASLAFFLVGAFFFQRLAHDLLGAQKARWATLAWLAQPLVFRYSGIAGVDVACIAAMFAFLWCAMKAVKSLRPIPILVACIAGSLCATLKLPFFFSAGLFLAGWLLWDERGSWKQWGTLMIVGAVSSLVFLLWTHQCNAVLATAQHPFVELRLSENPDMVAWYFGSIRYRLNPFNYARGGWRALTCLFGSWGLLGLAFFGIFMNRSRPAILLFASGFATILVFTKIILQHSHYYLMFTPATAMLMGIALAKLEEKASGLRGKRILHGAVVLGLGLSLIQGLFGMNITLHFDTYHREVAGIVAQYTSTEDKLLVQGGGWGNLFILAERNGHSINDVSSAIEELGGVEEIHKMGFSKLVLVSPESPMLNAVQRTKPGQANLPLKKYTGADEPPANEWKTLYRDEFVCIKDIPDPEDTLTPLE